MKKLLIVTAVWAIGIPAMAQDIDEVDDSALDRAVNGAEAAFYNADPMKFFITEGGAIIGVNPFDHPVAYAKTGLSNLKKEPGSWLGRNYGKTIGGGLFAWYTINPDGFKTSMEDAWSFLTGDEEDDDDKDRKRSSDAGDKALQNDPDSDDIVVKNSDGLNLDLEGVSFGDLVIDGCNGCSVNINEEQTKNDAPVR